MKSVIVGTAGHIDHGKTALVKALTGIDADRLEEEKRRGITIDIGFAHLELPAPDGETIRFGFVDVPGHERFVRNMLAGVGGIDLVLLVIAADESIKPQTREHFDICRLLSIPRGITVLTKTDAVDRETLDVVRLEVEEYLRGTFLDPARAPIIPVSSLTGAGLDELKRELTRIALDVPAKDSQAVFRLPIDRVFTMRGFGTVVTGTLFSGSVRLEDEVEIFPAGRRVRVRGIQVHGAAAKEAHAGQRTALNLAGVGTEDLARGMVLAPPGLFNATRNFDVQVTLLPSAKPLKNRARVHFHVQTAETIATVKLLDRSQALRPGAQAWVRLTLDEPVLVLPGDRFIIRQFSPVVTIGGGVVLDTHPQRTTIPNTPFAYDRFLPLMLAGEAQDVLHCRVARRLSEGFTVQDAIAETGWTRNQVEAQINALIKAKRIIRIGDTLADLNLYESLKAGIPAQIESQLERTRLAGGIAKEQLKNPRTHPAFFERVIADLVKAGKVEVSGDLVCLPGKGLQLRDEEAEAKKIIEQAFQSAGLRVPALKDVLASLKVDRVRSQKIVTLLLRDRVLVKVSDDLVFHRDALEALRRALAGYKAKCVRIDVSRFKDLTGVSRKYAIPLLEYLDRERVTRRVGDEREIL
jgi:selenocysteine-specific elongation factor